MTVCATANWRERERERDLIRYTMPGQGQVEFICTQDISATYMIILPSGQSAAATQPLRQLCTTTQRVGQSRDVTPSGGGGGKGGGPFMLPVV